MLKLQAKLLPLTMTLGLTVGSCASNNFSGGSREESPKKEKEAETSPPKPGPSASPGPECVPGKTTVVVTAKTPSVDQYAPDAKIVYDLVLSDCPGTTPQAKADKVQFDVDAIVSDVNEGIISTTRKNSIPYKIIVDGTPTPLSGMLGLVIGSDLFGKTGPEFGHYIANSATSFSAVQRHAVVEVSLTTIRIISPYGSQVDPSAKTMEIKTFFKFGDSPAVTVPVTVSK